MKMEHGKELKNKFGSFENILKAHGCYTRGLEKDLLLHMEKVLKRYLPEGDELKPLLERPLSGVKNREITNKKILVLYELGYNIEQINKKLNFTNAKGRLIKMGLFEEYKKKQCKGITRINPQY